MRQNHGHTPAGLQEIQVAFNKQKVTPDGTFVLPVVFLRDVIWGKHVGLLDIACEGRVRHNHVEVETAKIAALICAQFFQLRPTRPVCLLPFVLLGGLFPFLPIKRVHVQDVGLAVARNEVQAARHTYTLFVEVQREDLVRHVV